MGDFERDDQWQREQRDNILMPKLYERMRDTGKFFGYQVGDNYIFLDKGRCSTLVQKKFSVDTFIKTKRGRAFGIEEKIVRWHGVIYDAYCLETQSCTIAGREKHGWMIYGEADLFLYCFQQEDHSLLCHLLNFQKLKRWFRKQENLSDFRMEHTNNKSAGKLATIKKIRAQGDILLGEEVFVR